MDDDLKMALCLVAATFLQHPEEDLFDDDDDDVDDMVLRGRATETIEEPQLLEDENNPGETTAESFVDQIIPRFSEAEFKSHFRMLPSTYNLILQEIGHKLRRARLDGNSMISADKQVLVTLWRMATPDPYRSICQRFGIGKATAIRSVRRVTHAISSLAGKYIQWPQGDRAKEVMQGFHCDSEFPGVIGAIDGTHINIPAPREDPEEYCNRKGHHSIKLQAVCDESMLFTHICVGHVGSESDANVLRLSEVQSYFDQDEKFPEDSHLIGDGAFPIHPNLLVPFPDNGRLTMRQQNFNYRHASTRFVIEKALGLLKGRWRSLLHNLAMSHMEEVSYFVMACCVLHNFCLLQNDEEEGVVIADSINERGAAPVNDPHQQKLGEEKRERISQQLPLADD